MFSMWYILVVLDPEGETYARVADLGMYEITGPLLSSFFLS